MKFSFIEEQAILVLQKYGVSVGSKANIPPIPVEAIATICYGFGVGKKELDDGVLGELFPKSRVILVNSSNSFVRQRFTIAHELGHLQLHTVKMDREIIVSSEKNAGRLETEANAFAAALLMPKRLIYQHLIRETTDIGEDLEWLLGIVERLSDSDLGSINQLLFNMVFEDDKIDKIDLLPSSIEELARIFRVSRETLAIRLKTFGVLDKLFGEDSY